MDMGVPKTFLLTHDQIIRAPFPENKRFNRNASHTDFGIADDDTGLETGFNVSNLFRDDLQKQVCLFKDKVFDRNISSRE